MKALGKAYKEAEASTGDFKRLPAGGYIAKITAVEDKADKEYLNITFDIAEGEFAAFYSDEWGKEHPYAHSFVRSYKEKALGMFKGFLRSVDESNGTKFESRAEKGFQEGELVGKAVGLLIGYEEYRTNRGDVGQRTRVTATRSVETIRSGNFKVPELKVLGETQTANSPVAGFEQVNEEDLPF